MVSGLSQRSRGDGEWVISERGWWVGEGVNVGKITGEFNALLFPLIVCVVFFVAEEVATLLMGKLPNTTLFLGFDNETAMVQGLQQAESPSLPLIAQCFSNGAGESE